MISKCCSGQKDNTFVFLCVTKQKAAVYMTPIIYLQFWFSTFIFFRNDENNKKQSIISSRGVYGGVYW